MKTNNFHLNVTAKCFRRLLTLSVRFCKLMKSRSTKELASLVSPRKTISCITGTFEVIFAILHSKANVLKHMLKTAFVVVNLLLHLTFVFLQVGKTLLKMRILLFLICNCLVVGVANQLQTWHNMRHVVLVHRF